MQKTFQSMIFDLDGTLWDSAKSVAAAWNEGLKNEKDVNGSFTEADIRGIMGLNTRDIGAKLFASLGEHRRGELMKLCGDAERLLLPKTGGVLYEDVRETLDQLKKKVPLLIVSNCDTGYIEAFLAYHKLDDYFFDHLCYGDTGAEKALNIHTLVHRHSLVNAVYIGDTEKDRLAAKAAGVGFIHAAYGFGAVTERTPVITAFSTLLTYI